MLTTLARQLSALVIVVLASGACAAPSDAPATAELRRIAITVDDLPVALIDRYTEARQSEITDRLLAVLREHEAPAVGFVNESKLGDEGTVDPRRRTLLERWLVAGHELGNHGYDHLDLHRVEPDAWMADVLRGERVTRPLVEARGGALQWFRHPYLHAGRSAEVQRRTAEFLERHGYRIAPVTIDNGEWLYARAYADATARGDRDLARRLGRDYVRYMLDVIGYYEGQSRAITGELIPQVLLIHAYELNADWLDPLLDELERRGYGWIRLGEALKHPAYRRAIHGYTGPSGISWLHRWAITEGRDPAIFRGEPKVPEWVTAPAARRSDVPRTSGAPSPMLVDRAEVRTFKSAVNGVGYKLYVGLPQGYGDAGKRFPVIYTLDADYSFFIVRNILDHLAERNDLEEAIVVGIAYDGPLQYRRNRTRDYTPVFVPDGGYGPEYQKHSGGGPKFLEVIEREIIPLIDGAYATAVGDRTLAGHSYGGLFTAWTMFTRPDLFRRYVAVSPSLWYDDRLMMRVEQTFAKKHRALPVRAYFCVGSREVSSRGSMVADLDRFVTRVESRGYEGLAIATRVMNNETHNSVYPGGISNGLRFVFNSR